MLVEEAEWLGRQIEALADERLFPFVNIGSSTGVFRATTQPHIDAKIFTPLGRRGGPIYHVDLKRAPGVDLVGDIMDPAFMSDVRERTAPRCVLLSNVLEHVLDPEAAARAVMTIVPPGGT